MFEVVARVDMQLLGCYEVAARPFWIVAKVDACFRCFECFECFIIKTVFCCFGYSQWIRIVACTVRLRKQV